MKSPIVVLLFITVMVSLWIPAMAFADDPAGPPPSKSEKGADRKSPIDLFRKFISPADGDRCPMYPSCSHYAQEAFAKEGYLKGWILTCDRLIRCGRDETRLAPTIRKKGTKYAYDPLDANTFWWKKH